jgi:hypothetical protein
MSETIPLFSQRSHINLSQPFGPGDFFGVLLSVAERQILVDDVFATFVFVDEFEHFAQR